jgi:hypothetical protein
MEPETKGTEEVKDEEVRCFGRKWKKGEHAHGVPSGVYGLAFIGAAIYYIGQATTFWGGVLGILKAVAWPALLVFNLLEFLKM